MEPFLEREEATTTSQLAGILPGQPPRINLVDFASGRDGLKRHFAQQVPVADPDLFARLQAEVRVGDHIRATVVNEYRETGSRVYLRDFQKVVDPRHIEITTTKGDTSISHDDIGEIVMPTVQKSKTSVGK